MKFKKKKFSKGKKMKFFTFLKTSFGWLLWFGDLCQIGYDQNGEKAWGYHNNYKEYGIRENGTFEKIFCCGKYWICWDEYQEEE